jgi:hypothetical protein
MAGSSQVLASWTPPERQPGSTETVAQKRVKKILRKEDQRLFKEAVWKHSDVTDEAWDLFAENGAPPWKLCTLH